MIGWTLCGFDPGTASHIIICTTFTHFIMFDVDYYRQELKELRRSIKKLDWLIHWRKSTHICRKYRVFQYLLIRNSPGNPDSWIGLQRIICAIQLDQSHTFFGKFKIKENSKYLIQMLNKRIEWKWRIMTGKEGFCSSIEILIILHLHNSFVLFCS